MLCIADMLRTSDSAYNVIFARNDRQEVIMCKYDVIYRTGSTQHVATPPEENRGTACTENGEDLVRVVIEICVRTDGQTDRQIGTFIRDSAPLPAAE